MSAQANPDGVCSANTDQQHDTVRYYDQIEQRWQREVCASLAAAEQRFDLLSKTVFATNISVGGSR